MSEENVELVRAGFEALRSGGVEALLAGVARDVVAYTAPEWIEASEYRGHEGLRSLTRVWTDNFDDWTVETPELRDAGDSVVALFEHGGTIKGTDVTIRQPMGAVFSDFRDGQVREVRFFQSWHEALEVAGLSE